MKKFFLITIFLASFSTLSALEYGPEELLFNQNDYFQKDHFVVNDFYPEMKLSDFWEMYRGSVGILNPERQNSIHLKIGERDWNDMMSHYLSENRFTGREWYPFAGSIYHDGDSQKFYGKIKHRGNYSSKSLKVGFRLKLEHAFHSGPFEDKKRIIFRHLVFDRTGTNEFVYFNGFKELHKNILGYDNMMVDLEYYWVFINNRPYGYYLVMNDSKDEIMESRQGVKFDKDQGCIVKAKTWRRDVSANMEYKESLEDFAFFNDIYRIEEGDVDRCYEEFMQLLKDIRDKNFEILDTKIANWDQIALYAHYQDLTENKAGVFQNYLMIKHQGRWEISPWDGDLTFLMDARIDQSVVRENKLLDLALERSDLEFDEIKARMHLGRLLKRAFAQHIEAVLLDRKVWSRYIPRTEKYIPTTYYKYATGEFGTKEIHRFISNLYRSTYKFFIVKNPS